MKTTWTFIELGWLLRPPLRFSIGNRQLIVAKLFLFQVLVYQSVSSDSYQESWEEIFSTFLVILYNFTWATLYCIVLIDKSILLWLSYGIVLVFDIWMLNTFYACYCNLTRNQQIMSPMRAFYQVEALINWG